MTFEIVADNLARQAEIKSLKLSNAEYDVTIFYYGDYQQDRKNGTLDVRNVSMNCRPKNGNLVLALMSTEVMIDLTAGFLLRRKELTAYRELLDVAEENAAELQRLLKEYFDVEPDA